jgi:flavin-dependent dehydrogenase
LKYDVVVVGGSSAGLYAAEILAKAGKKVILFEQADNYHPANRTYIITPGLFNAMPDIDPGLILHSSSKFILHAGDIKTVLDLSSPDLVIDRSQLISSLMNRARKAGVELHYGSKFKGITTENGISWIEIISEDGLKSYQSDNLIAADGINNTVGKAVGLSDPVVVPLIQAEVSLPNDWDPGVTRIWFEVEDTSYFFWFIPDSEKSGVIGLISDPKVKIKQVLEQFLERHQITPLRYQSGSAALHTPTLLNEIRKGTIRILRVGDAAGQVKNTTVGGTVTGLVGALAAAQAVLNNTLYKVSLNDVKRELDLHAFIRFLLSKMSQADYQLLLHSLNPAVLSFLRKNNRDSMRSQFWKLVFIQPRFILLGIRLLLK